MNARILLLLLVAGLFMAAWDSDRTANQEFLAKRTQQRTAMAKADDGTVSEIPARPEICGRSATDRISPIIRRS